MSRHHRENPVLQVWCFRSVSFRCRIESLSCRYLKLHCGLNFALQPFWAIVSTGDLEDDIISNIWTSDWHRETLELERIRLGTPNVLILPVTGFLDGTNLNTFAANSAMPFLISLLNYTLECLGADDSKKVFGFYPDLGFLSKAQKARKDVQKWMKDLDAYVAGKFVDSISEVYTTGIPWTDSKGVEYIVVPVVPFLVADMGEAFWMKGVRDNYRAIRPCHLCTVNYVDTHRVIKHHLLVYRDGDKATRRIKKWIRIRRSVCDSRTSEGSHSCSEKEGENGWKRSWDLSLGWLYVSLEISI